jgi:ubiquinone/menaquinone biosynthesis C-methylase UbiE
MANSVCPWWVGYVLVSPVRRLLEPPTKLLGPFVAKDMALLEPGCGMGYFTLDLARMVGNAGRVVALDVQPRMLTALRRRAARAGLADRIEARLARADRLGVEDLAGTVDLALAIHVVHEVPDRHGFFAELRATLKPTGRLLLVEPRGHVSEMAFAATLAMADAVGLRRLVAPRFGLSRAALLAPV